MTDQRKGRRPAPSPPAARPDVPPHQQCPLCFQGLGGKGRCYSTRGQTRYYKCKSCGHTWTAQVTAEVTRIEHRTVELEERGDGSA
jgi:rubredoxin